MHYRAPQDELEFESCCDPIHGEEDSESPSRTTKMGMMGIFISWRRIKYERGSTRLNFNINLNPWVPKSYIYPSMRKFDTNGSIF